MIHDLRMVFSWLVIAALLMLGGLLLLLNLSCSPSTAQVVQPVVETPTAAPVEIPKEPPPHKFAVVAGDWQTLMVVNLVRVSCLGSDGVDEDCYHDAIECMMKFGNRELTAEEIITCSK